MKTYEKSIKTLSEQLAMTYLSGGERFPSEECATVAEIYGVEYESVISAVKAGFGAAVKELA
jgi:hypothetical protein